MAGDVERQIDDFYIEVGRRLQDARRRAGMTQAQLAAQAAMTRSSIANVEAGRQRIPLHLFAAITQALKIDLRVVMPTATYVKQADPLAELDTHLAEAPESTRHFVEGAIAQLGLDNRKED